MSCIVSTAGVSVDGVQNIVLCVRDSSYKRTKLFIPFYPYFYVREFDYDKLKNYVSKDITRNFKSTQGGFRGVDGFRLRRIVVDEPHDIGEINKQLIGTNVPLYESNIPYPYRYLIDNGLVTGVNYTLTNGKVSHIEPVDCESYHKIAFIDIEVLKDSKPDPKKDPVTIIGIFDYVTKKYYTLYVGDKYELDLSVIKTEYKEVVEIPCKSEVDMFGAFAKIWLSIEPDIISSFSTFDMYYLINRMYALNIDPSYLSPVFQVRVGKTEKEVRIGCVHIVDFAEVYRKIMGEPVWNTLGYISQEELGYGKLEVHSFVEMWLKDKKSLIEYNLRDVELLNDLENKIGVLKNYLLQIWKRTGLDLADCLMANSVGDILHLRHVSGNVEGVSKVVLYSKSPNEFIPYEGALVGAKIGRHSNVCVLDWNELYPTIMEMFNMSIDTFDPMCGVKITEDRDVRLNAGFTMDKMGWTIQIMKPLRAYRQSVKQLSKKATNDEEKRRLKLLSQAVKVVINSLYGLYGQKTDKFTSRFYDARIANAICLIGRILNVEARRIVEELGYEWVYFDTDSLFIKLHGTDGEVQMLKETIEEKLRVFLKEKYGVTSLLRLDFEYTFSTILVLAKKKYMGMPIGASKPISKGITIVQKNTAKITAIEEEKVGKMRIAGIPVKEVKKYIDERYHRVKMGKESLENIAVKAKLSKKFYPRATAALKATIYAKQKYGLEIPLGTRFYWVYCHPKNDTIQALYDGEYKTYPANIIAFTSIEQLPSDIVVDYKKMADRVIRKPLAHYIEEEEVNNQSPLSKFF